MAATIIDAPMIATLVPCVGSASSVTLLMSACLSFQLTIEAIGAHFMAHPLVVPRRPHVLSEWPESRLANAALVEGPTTWAAFGSVAT